MVGDHPGSKLMASSAQAAVLRNAQSGLYLWVLEQNLDAQAFYQALGGECVERQEVPPPGGIASRLMGSPHRLRYAWRDPSVLMPVTLAL